MLSRIYSFTPVGIDAQLVEVEVDLITSGQEAFTTIVGLPDASVKESKVRLSAAVKNAGFKFPRKRVVINLAPADIKKQGSVFDLPMAIGILISSNQLPPPPDKSIALIGELALDGSVRPVNGALAAAMAAKKAGIKRLIIPRENAGEAGLVREIEVYPVNSLGDAVKMLESPIQFEPYQIDIESIFEKAREYDIDFADVRGQEHAKRAAEVAVQDQPLGTAQD